MAFEEQMFVRFSVDVVLFTSVSNDTLLVPPCYGYNLKTLASSSCPSTFLSQKFQIHFVAVVQLTLRQEQQLFLATLVTS